MTFRAKHLLGIEPLHPTEITTLLHGADAAAAAADTAREVYEKGGVGEDLPTLT